MTKAIFYGTGPLEDPPVGTLGVPEDLRLLIDAEKKVVDEGNPGVVDPIHEKGLD